MMTWKNFAIVNKVTFDGLGSEYAGHISLDTQGKIIWMINSDSIDGDFAGAAESNRN